jgi:uncharacterized protein (TIGR03437 family)
VRLFAAVAVAALAPVAAAQVQLQFASQPANYNRVLQLPSGDQVLVGSYLAVGPTGLYPAQTERWRIVLSDFGSRFGPAQTLLGGHGNDIPQDAAVDPAGNVWIAGQTDSDDFQLVNPIFAQKVPYRTAGFVLELDPTGKKLLFATYLAGQEGSTSTSALNFCSTSASAIATDSAGNIYVGGTTNEADLLASPAVNLNSTSCTDNFGNTSYYSFVVKISPAGKLVYGKRLITGTSQCIGGSRCINQMSTQANVKNLAVDATGAVTVAGIASGSWNPGNGCILKLAPDGSQPLWSTNTPANFQSVLNLSMAQDSAGNIDLFGQYAPLIEVPDLAPETGTPGLFAAQLKPDGSAFGYVTDLGQSSDAQVAGIVLDVPGYIHLAGTSSSPQFPTVSGAPNLGPDFVLLLGPSGAAPQMLFRLSRGVVTAPPAFDQNGRLLLIGVQSALLTLALSYDTPAIVGYANSASNAMNTGLYAGALITLYGFSLPSSLEDVQVSIANLPAPMLYAGPNQINLQVPFEIPGSDPLPVQVVLPGESLSLELPWSPAIGVFTVDGTYAAALNQDGTVNAASNPAPAGSIVTLFGTGAIWPPGMRDGAAATTLIPTYYSFELVDYPLSTAVLYAGTAPGLIDGVFQVNVQLPLEPSGPFALQEYTGFNPPLPSNFFQLYVK